MKKDRRRNAMSHIAVMSILELFFDNFILAIVFTFLIKAEKEKLPSP
jgi:hypothetical protein